MSNVSVLKVELALPEYVALSDQERYDSLLVQDIAIKVSIPSVKISAKLEVLNKWYQMHIFIDTDPEYATAQHMILVLETFSAFDMNDSDQEIVFNNLMSAMVSNNIVSQLEADEMAAYGDELITRADEIGINDLKIGEVAEART